MKNTKLTDSTQPEDRPKSTAGEAPHIDADFFQTFNPPLEFEVRGITLRCRGLDLDDFKALKGRYIEWNGFDLLSLVQAEGVEAMKDIIWLGMQDLGNEQHIPTKDHLDVAINTRTFDQWLTGYDIIGNIKRGETEDQLKNEIGGGVDDSKTGDTPSP